MIVLKNQEIRGHLHNLVNHFMDLDKEAHYMRFFNMRSEEMIRDWIEQTIHSRDSTDHIWIIEEDGARIIAVGQIIIDMNNIAELAISVSRDKQDNGIGSKIIEEMIRVSEKNGVKRIEIEFIPTNHRIVNIALKQGFVFISDEHGFRGVKELENKSS